MENIIPDNNSVQKLIEDLLKMDEIIDLEERNIRDIGERMLDIYWGQDHNEANEQILKYLKTIKLHTLTNLYCMIDSPKTPESLETTIRILAILMELTGWDGVKEFDEKKYWDISNIIADCFLAVSTIPRPVIETASRFFHDPDRYVVLSALLHVCDGWLCGGYSRSVDLTNFMPELDELFESEDESIRHLSKVTREYAEKKLAGQKP